MTDILIAERVRTYLATQGVALCDSCVAKALELRHQQANRVTMALGTTSDFQRAEGSCSRCGRFLKVTMLKAGSPGSAQFAFARHEVQHTAYLASDFFDRHILESAVVQADSELKEAASRISDALGDFYQLAARKG